MLTTDLSLKEDPAYRKIAKRFQENPEEFELELIDAGIEEVELEEDMFMTTTPMEEFHNVQKKLEEMGLEPRISAEVDDMAMLRLLARDSGSLALVPEVVVQDELREHLEEQSVWPGERESHLHRAQLADLAHFTGGVFSLSGVPYSGGPLSSSFTTDSDFDTGGGITIENVKGKVKEKIYHAKDYLGERYQAVSDKVKNRYESAANTAREKASEVKSRVDQVEMDDVVDQMRDYVRSNPGKALLISIGVGFGSTVT